jgi:TPR repeat protein
MLANGTGGPKDPERAMALLEAAAALPWENADAQFWLVKHSQDSLICPENAERAMRLCQVVGTRGYVDAVVSLGIMHLRGQGGARDPKMAETIRKQAGDRGNGRALLNLAALYGRDSEAPEMVNLPESRRTLKKAAELEEPMSLQKLETILCRELETNTEGEPRTKRETHTGLPIAMYSYGKLRMRECDLPKDSEEAYE